jgi:hypothetical protein
MRHDEDGHIVHRHRARLSFVLLNHQLSVLNTEPRRGLAEFEDAVSQLCSQRRPN